MHGISAWEKKAMELFYEAKIAYPKYYSKDEFWYNTTSQERNYWYDFVWFKR